MASQNRGPPDPGWAENQAQVLPTAFITDDAHDGFSYDQLDLYAAPTASRDLPTIHLSRTSSNTLSPAPSLALVRVQANIMTDNEHESLAASEAEAISPPALLLPELSRFERIISTCEPVLNSLLANLPTSTIFKLRCTSRFLRDFLDDYPLAFRTISFRQQQQLLVGSTVHDLSDSQNPEAFSLDLVLKMVVLPVAKLLTNLDLCNTSVEGVTLVGMLENESGPRRTLKHLSVRGCKHVSLKYHIVPLLRNYEQQRRRYPKRAKLALESLYTYRCRHHRRRPYLPISLTRRDSDSEPTHELIKLCHLLGIWTDTAWCPTPGPRCLRRKDYHGNRGGPGHNEVWVPFDRLWRSSNRIGPGSNDSENSKKPVGKLWEETESGHDGEPLGLGDGTFSGEGKDVPAHKRVSHKTFIEDVKCDSCNDIIPERCETCSIKMHCMGCRKTFCYNCSFNRAYSRKKLASSTSSLSTDMEAEGEKRSDDDLWWAAPGATRSPNQMIDFIDSDDQDLNGPPPPPGAAVVLHPPPLKLLLQWCCLEPLFSGGGGVAFVGPGLGGPGSERIRAVPLPKNAQFIDEEFTSTTHDHGAKEGQASTEEAFEASRRRFEQLTGENIDVLPYLQQNSSHMDLQYLTCPRSLCKHCYDETFDWKVSCRACKRPICREHDFRTLKVRKCGYRELVEEREYVLNPPEEAREAMKRSEALAAAHEKGKRALRGRFGIYMVDGEGSDGLETTEVDVNGREWPRSLVIPAFKRARLVNNGATSGSPSNLRNEINADDATDGASIGSASGGGDAEDRRRGRSARTDEMSSDADSTADGPGTRDPSNAPMSSSSLTLRVLMTGGERAASVAPIPSPPGNTLYNTWQTGDDDFSNIVSNYHDTPDGLVDPTTPIASENPHPASPQSTIPPTATPRRARSVSMSDVLNLASSSSSPSSSRNSPAHNLNGPNFNALKKKSMKYVQGLASKNVDPPLSPILPPERMLLPGNGRHPVQWHGCGAYFCQNVRPMGDNRGRCSSGGKECAECGVFVCEGCLPSAKTCACTFCSQTFHCDFCLTKPLIKASCQDEVDRQRERKRQKDIRETQERLAAMGAGFWELLVGRGYVDDVEADTFETDSVEVPSRRSRPTMVDERGSGEAGATEDNMQHDDGMLLVPQNNMREVEAGSETDVVPEEEEEAALMAARVAASESVQQQQQQ